MIFVTVGTHEQPFNRLIKYVDKLKEKNILQEDVVIQIGYSTYEPKYCQWKRMFSYDEMQKNVRDARIVITHGGPASFLLPLQMQKIPIVVPRQKKYGEHINDHQLIFTKTVEERQHNIVLVEDITNLKNCIIKYDSIIRKIPQKSESNNKKFNEAFEKLVEKLFISSPKH